MYVATYISHNNRVIGPLVDLTMNNQELGWVNQQSDIEIHYDDMYNVNALNIVIPRLGQSSFHLLALDQLNVEYNNIMRYHQVTREL